MQKFYVIHLKPLIILGLFVGAVSLFSGAVCTLYGLKKYRVVKEKIKQDKIQNRKKIDKILSEHGFIINASQQPTASDFFWAGFIF